MSAKYLHTVCVILGSLGHAELNVEESVLFEFHVVRDGHIDFRAVTDQ